MALFRARSGGTGSAPPAPAVSSLAHPPNILVFITDDQNVGTWSAMPRTTRLVRDHGITFTRGDVLNPSCCPSRAAILTGDWSHTTGVYTNRSKNGGFRTFYRNGNEQRTIATYLDPTYDTALFGKYLNGYSSYAERLGRHGYVPPGWDDWEAFYGQNGSYYDYRLNVNGRLIRYGSDPQDYSTDVIGARLRDWLDPSDGDGRDPTQPFFAYVAAFSPHGPTDASPTYGDGQRFLDLPPYRSPAVNERDVSDKPSYIRALPPFDRQWMDRLTHNKWRRQHQSLFSYDRQIGLTLRVLHQEHELHNTMVIVMSDNGEETGEHRWDYKLVPYQRSIQVPLAIRYDRLDREPGHERRARFRRERRPVPDDRIARARPQVAAARAGGWRVPARRAARHAARSAAHVDGPGNGYYPRAGRPAVPTYCGILTRRWKYVVYSPTPSDPGLVAAPEEDELYDLKRDPYELHNVASSRPGIAARLRKRLVSACSPTPPGWAVPW